MKNSTLVLGIFILAASDLIAQGIATTPPPQVINDAIPGRVISIDRNGSGSQAELKGFRVRLSGTADLDIVMIRELSTGLLLWRFYDVTSQSLEDALRDFLEAHAVSATESKIAVFTFVMPELRVRESTQRYSSMSAAREAVLETLRREQQAFEEDRFIQFVRIDAFPHVRDDLFPIGGFPSETPLVSEVRKTAAGWTVTLRGVEGATETLDLNESFAIVGALATPLRQELN